MKYKLLSVVFCMSLMTQMTVRAEEKLICDTGKMLVIEADSAYAAAEEEGQILARFGSKFTMPDGTESNSWCYFTGINMYKQYEEEFKDQYRSTLEEVIFSLVLITIAHKEEC
jgi:hypothetical protein